MINPTQKHPAKRAFTGIAGSPLAQVAGAKSKSALRGERYRAAQKQKNPQFNREERDRKRTERQKERDEKFIQEHKKEFPLNLDQLRRIDDITAPKHIFLSGGTADLEKVIADRVREVHGGKVKPEGNGPDTEKGEEPNWQNKIERMRMPKDKLERAVGAFVRSHLRNMSGNLTDQMTCILCREKIADYFDLLLALAHFSDDHRQQLDAAVQEALQPKKRKPRICQEDHEGIVKRHGGGKHPVVCGKCKKVLYRPTAG
jgi:hypothetical protein